MEKAKSKVENGNNNETKLKKSAKIVELVFNIVFIPFIIFASIFTFSIVISKIQTGVASIFGYTQMRIVSGSMQDAGFRIGDEFFVKSTNADELQIGDYIAFYQFKDPDCSIPSMVTEENYPTARPSGRIVFHEIVDITLDTNNNRWFTTKGTNNLDEDSVLIYEKYVVGKWVEKDNFLTNLITFITSPIGIISLVAIPCSLIIGIDVYQLIIYSHKYHQLLKATNSKTENDEINFANELKEEKNKKKGNKKNSKSEIKEIDLKVKNIKNSENKNK